MLAHDKRLARVTLTYLRTELIRTWKAGAASALVIHGLHGAVQPIVRTPPAGAAAYVPLREIWHGLETEIHRVSGARATVWMWRRVSVDAIPRTTA